LSHTSAACVTASLVLSSSVARPSLVRRLSVACPCWQSRAMWPIVPQFQHLTFAYRLLHRPRPLPLPSPSPSSLSPLSRHYRLPTQLASHLANQTRSDILIMTTILVGSSHRQGNWLQPTAPPVANHSVETPQRMQRSRPITCQGIAVRDGGSSSEQLQNGVHRHLYDPARPKSTHGAAQLCQVLDTFSMAHHIAHTTVTQVP
jgi:hypothetical protein